MTFKSSGINRATTLLQWNELNPHTHHLSQMKLLGPDHIQSIGHVVKAGTQLVRLDKEPQHAAKIWVLTEYDL